MENSRKKYFPFSRMIGLCALLIVIVSGVLGRMAIIQGGKQMIPIKSFPDEANVTIYNNKGEEIANAKTPYTAALQRGSKFFTPAKYKIVIEKDGYQSDEVQLTAKLNDWYLIGNTIFGGLIGCLAVDPGTGAMWTLTPKEITSNLISEKVSFFNQNKGLIIIFKKDPP